MKYLAVLLFNLIAFYLLSVFIFGNGGMIDSLRKIREIGRLERERIVVETEVEELKSRLDRLKKRSGLDSEAFLAQGRKSGDLVIFKFVEPGAKPAETDVGENEPLLFQRVYATAFLIAVLILAGNLLILRQLSRQRGPSAAGPA